MIGVVRRLAAAWNYVGVADDEVDDEVGDGDIVLIDVI
jgi:hypothetical protein